MPAYSRMRMSGNAAAPVNLTVTTLPGRRGGDVLGVVDRLRQEAGQHRRPDRQRVGVAGRVADRIDRRRAVVPADDDDVEVARVLRLGERRGHCRRRRLRLENALCTNVGVRRRRRSGLGRRGRGVRVRPEVVRRVAGAHAVAVAGRRGQPGVAERRGRRGADLRERRAAGALAALDQVRRHGDVVGRRGPGQPDLAAGRRASPPGSTAPSAASRRRTGSPGRGGRIRAQVVRRVGGAHAVAVAGLRGRAPVSLNDVRRAAWRSAQSSSSRRPGSAR